jgi:iron complex outermembrane receptor protein
MMKYIFLTFTFTVGLSVFSQNDSINNLEEVVLYGNFSPALNSGYYVETINDSVLKNENLSLGALLQKKMNLYFKENGSGMVSSISLRGTSAAHTGVYWNGIAINSSMNGQTDFNTVSANGFDAVDIRKGGGSVLLGSGAIGGAINLRDRLYFEPGKHVFVQLGGGSFRTFRGNVQAGLSSARYFAKISLNYISSRNDYPYPDSALYNENGAYKNYGIQTVLGWKPNENNQVSLHTYYTDNDRDISRTLTAPGHSKLLNKDKRFLLSWKNTGTRYTSGLDLSYLGEEYSYLFRKDDPESATGNQSRNFIAKYDLAWFLLKNASVKAGFINTYSSGKGDNIGTVSQNDTEIYALWHQEIFNRLTYNVSMRKGFSSVYSIPFIYAADLVYRINDNFSLKSNYSTNYRLPTFNDLYWVPGGNPDLEPENSNTGEIGIVFDDQSFKMTASAYFLNSENLIRWLPADNNDLWKPVNIKESSGYGFEFELQKEKKIGEHSLQAAVQYAYTVSKDDEKDKQLIYVPYHKGNGNIQYRYKRLSFNYNLQYTGEVFITSSNSQSLDAYWLSAAEIGYGFFKNKMNIGLRVNNLFDKEYQSVAYRPMPNRNYELNINFKID